MKRKHRVFTSLSRRKRRAKTREIKNLIHRELILPSNSGHATK